MVFIIIVSVRFGIGRDLCRQLTPCLPQLAREGGTRLGAQEPADA